MQFTQSIVCGAVWVRLDACVLFSARYHYVCVRNVVNRSTSKTIKSNQIQSNQTYFTKN